MYSNELICNIIEYLNKNINNQITITELSDKYFYDKTYIMKRFKKELGITIKDYINTKRILNSLDNYTQNNSILRIALLNGYNSIEYYSEVFKDIMGVSPRIYKKFISPLNNLSDKERNTIRASFSKLTNQENKIQKYLNNQKPKTLPIRKLSIFN